MLQETHSSFISSTILLCLYTSRCSARYLPLYLVISGYIVSARYLPLYLVISGYMVSARYLPLYLVISGYIWLYGICQISSFISSTILLCLSIHLAVVPAIWLYTWLYLVIWYLPDI